MKALLWLAVVASAAAALKTGNPLHWVAAAAFLVAAVGTSARRA
jgi:hypothetical protein